MSIKYDFVERVKSKTETTAKLPAEVAVRRSLHRWDIAGPRTDYVYAGSTKGDKSELVRLCFGKSMLLQITCTHVCCAGGFARIRKS